MMASCNNCSLKEKEQVYTAARDGNLMYLKVSVVKEQKVFLVGGTKHFAPLLPKKPARRNFNEPWTFISVYFDSIFAAFCARSWLSGHFIDFDSNCPINATLSLSRHPCESDRLAVKRQCSVNSETFSLKPELVCECEMNASIISYEGYNFSVLLFSPTISASHFGCEEIFHFEGFSPSVGVDFWVFLGDTEIRTIDFWKIVKLIMTCRDVVFAIVFALSPTAKFERQCWVAKAKEKLIDYDSLNHQLSITPLNCFGVVHGERQVHI